MELFNQHSGLWLLGLATALLATGLVAGVLAGLLGVGGGIVIVPVLYHLFTLLGIDESVRMHVAVGTSLATIVPTSIMSARTHHKRGNLNPSILREAVVDLLDDNLERQSMSRCGRYLIDGRGNDRIVTAFEVMMHPYQQMERIREAA